MNRQGLRNSLVLTTSLVASSLYVGSYSRRAHAACVLMGGTYFCEGASAGIAITANDATVETLPVPPNNQFVINEPAVDGLNISGLGAISFTDNHNALITASVADALSISSTGDNGGTPGSVTVLSNGTFLGDESGVEATNLGTGALSIITTGTVTGTNDRGVYAFTRGASLSITTGPGSVLGGFIGVNAINYGTAGLTIQVSGDVTGTTLDGIRAENGAVGDPTYLSIITGPGTVTGGNNGINAANTGTEGVDIQVFGDVTGNGNHGINAINSANDLTASMNIYQAAGTTTYGFVNGIDAENNAGSLTISALGTSTGGTGDGIHADNNYNALNPGGLAITANNAYGQESGVFGVNTSTGGLSIITTGTVTGTNDRGVYAFNGSNGTSLSITTGPGSVMGGFIGVNAINYGTAGLTIQVSGDVTGTTLDGIRAENDASTTSLSVITGPGAVTGGNDGINASNAGTGSTTLVLGGDVTGGAGAGAGVRVSSVTMTTLTNFGTLSALSDRAISSGNEVDAIANFSEVIGFVELGGGGDTFANEAGGIFSARGDSDFGMGIDEFDNKAGATFRLLDSGGADTVNLLGLETFDNSSGGSIVLADGGAGDMLSLSGGFTTGGNLQLDVVVDNAAPTADLLSVGGTVTFSGTPTVIIPTVVAVNSSPLPAAGVTVVTTNGTALGDFSLFSGFFDFTLNLVGNDWVLNGSGGLSASGLELPALITAQQNIWHSTNAPHGERMADLRSVLNGTNGVNGLTVTPVASTGRPDRRSSADHGLWGRVIGGTAEYDADNGVDYDQDTVSVQFGYDRVLQPNGMDGYVIVGLLGGYTYSDVAFESSSTDGTFAGGTFGGYLSYVSGSFYADILVKADITELSLNAPAVAATADLDATSVGASLDTGYRFEFGNGAFFEPLAHLAYVRTDLESFTVPAGTVRFEDGDSLRGALGARLGMTYGLDGGGHVEPYLEARIYQEFEGDNSASVSGFGLTGVATDDADNTWGEVGLGIRFTDGGDITGFVDTDVQFGEHVWGVTAKGGVRFSF